MQKNSEKHLLNYLHQYNGEIVTLDVLVLSKIYFNEDNSYGIYQVTIEDNEISGAKTFTAVGNMDLEPDRTYRIKGEVFYNDKYGYQLINAEAIRTLPHKKESIKRMLCHLHGIGLAMSIYLYDEYGDKVLDVLMDEPERIIKEVKGIGEKTIEKARNHLISERKRFEAMDELCSIGLSAKMLNNLFSNSDWEEIYKHIKTNPYELSIRGMISFAEADEVAREIGLSADNRNRIKGIIINCLNLLSLSKGDCYCEMDNLYEYVKEIGMVFIPSEHDEYVSSKGNAVEINYFGIRKQMTYPVYRKYKNMAVEKEHPITFQKYERTVIKVYEIPRDVFDDICEEMKNDKMIAIYGDKVLLHDIDWAERNIARSIIEMKRSKEMKFSPAQAERMLDKILSERGITLSEDQRKAIIGLATSDFGFNLLLGSAGCGKTFSLKLFIELYRRLRKIDKDYQFVEILAPTGRASKVASLATGIPAKTIHRACKIDENSSSVSSKSLIMSDIVIVDETSMLDVRLASVLLSSITPASMVIFVGDIKQLPPVGAGKVLYDIIESGVVDVYTLSTNQRQKDGSGIIHNANRIISQKMIQDTKDCRVIFSENDAQTTKEVFRDFKKSLLENKISDVQIITPMWNYANGINFLNYELQRIYNPILTEETPKKQIGSFFYKGQNTPIYIHRGDKVINTKNDVDCVFFKKVKSKKTGEIKFVPNGKTMIANGDIGLIVDIKTTFSEEFYKMIDVVVVKFDDGYTFFYEKTSKEYCHLKNLSLAFAISFHKSQGSQWKHVIMIINKNNEKMVNNNLIYTGLTRAQESITVICDGLTLEKGIHETSSFDRKTMLKEKLMEENEL